MSEITSSVGATGVTGGSEGFLLFFSISPFIGKIQKTLKNSRSSRSAPEMACMIARTTVGSFAVPCVAWDAHPQHRVLRRESGRREGSRCEALGSTRVGR